jgi:hypothetical protein
MNDHLFYKIAQKSTVRKELLDYALSIKEWPRPRTFLSTSCPKEIYSKDILFEKLSSIIRQDQFAYYIFKIPAQTYYGLHVDSIRNYAFNMLLNDHSNSVSFFTNTQFEHTQCKITELVYEQDHLYLFNTQNRHAVLNQGDDRFVLSIQGNESYDKALKFIKENNL